MMIENQRVHGCGAAGEGRQAANPSGGWPVHGAARYGGGYPRNRLRLLSDLTPVRFSVSKSILAEGRANFNSGRVGGPGASGAEDGAGRGSGAGEGLPYVFRWNRMGRKGQRCQVLARGTMNSCLVKFADGHTAVTSRNAIRKAKPNDR